MLLPAHRAYLANSLGGTPDVLEGLLASVPAGDPAWDSRPDASRFSLREIVAHAADWEEIWADRVTRTRDLDVPLLPQFDEGRIAQEHGYAYADPHASLARFRAGREALVALLRSLEQAQWEREAERDGIGRCSVEAMMTTALAHDVYHLQEAAKWLAAAREATR